MMIWTDIFYDPPPPKKSDDEPDPPPLPGMSYIEQDFAKDKVWTPLKGNSALVRTRSTTTRDRNLQFRGSFSTGFFLSFLQWKFFLFLQVFLCNLIRKWPQTVEKVARFRVERQAQNPVTSLAVRVISVPSKRVFVEAIVQASKRP